MVLRRSSLDSTLLPVDLPNYHACLVWYLWKAVASFQYQKELKQLFRSSDSKHTLNGATAAAAADDADDCNDSYDNGGKRTFNA